MKPTLFIMGPSDIEGQSWTKKEDCENGRVKGTAEWAGILPIQSFIWNDPSLKAKSEFFLIGIHKENQALKNMRLNLFNLVGDAEASKTSLRTIEAMSNEIQPQRYFNRASAVFKTSREKLPKTLSNIPGCRVPRVKLSKPTSFSELEKACDAFDTWPLIVRARGYHGGEHMTLLTGRSELESIKGNVWLYDGIFLMEFVDFKNEENLYQKNRVIFVDGVPYPRHSIISDQWAIHGRNRTDLMDRDLALCRQEEHFLAYLRDTGLNEYGEVFSAIQERIGLDIFGVDFALVDGQVVVFEANACMDFATHIPDDQGRYGYLLKYMKTLQRAVKKMLMTA